MTFFWSQQFSITNKLLNKVINKVPIKIKRRKSVYLLSEQCCLERNQTVKKKINKKTLDTSPIKL